ncbi:MAG: hypothetical protein WBC92_04870 [Terracidiphilus sp.]
MLRLKSTPFVALLRLLLFAVIQLGLVSWSQSHSTDIRSIDFKNFSYPWVHPHGWPDNLQWMSLRLKEHVRLVNGKWDGRDSSDRADGEQFSGLTLEGVQYARLSSDRSEDAIVVLRYDSGGTQNHYWVYIYDNSSGRQKLLGFFHAGDRAAHGLYQVFVKDRVLNVELFDPRFQEGDCCSSGYLNYRFRWNGEGFEAMGNPISGHPDLNSRRPVSVFGLPTDQP